MAIALLAKLRSLLTAAIQYPYIVITLPRIIAISSHTYVSRTIRLEPALTYLSSQEMSPSGEALCKLMEKYAMP